MIMIMYMGNKPLWCGWNMIKCNLRLGYYDTNFSAGATSNFMEFCSIMLNTNPSVLAIVWAYELDSKGSKMRKRFAY